MMDDVLKAGGSPRRRRANVPVKALGEDSPTAQHCVAVEPSRINDKPNRLPTKGIVNLMGARQW